MGAMLVTQAHQDNHHLTDFKPLLFSITCLPVHFAPLRKNKRAPTLGRAGLLPYANGPRDLKLRHL